jgi:thiol-disulfide isomerase/thioredoxin
MSLAACTPTTDHHLPPGQRVADVSLNDVNPTSASYDEMVSPRDHLGHASAWYFAASTCTYCRWQYEHLDDIQRELDAQHPNLGIAILAVNRTGYEAKVEAMAALGDIPLLQDTREEDCWHKWYVEYRDVIILDGDNHPFFTYNLTDNDLADPDVRTELIDRLLDAAE